MVSFLAEMALLDLLSEVVVDFLEEVLSIEKPEFNVVIVKFPEVFLFTVLPAVVGFVLESCNHFLVVASALFLIPGSNEFAHFNIIALGFVVGIVEQFISLAGQKEMVAEFLLCVPVGDLFCHRKLISCKK